MSTNVAGSPRCGHFYAGVWNEPRNGVLATTLNPATQERLGCYPVGDARDVDAAVSAARDAFRSWRRSTPRDRAECLRKAAGILRDHKDELALVDSLNCGNPIREMAQDVLSAAAMLDYFAGVLPALKGETIPVHDGSLNLTLREPLGVIARIYPSNHPLLFAASRIAAPIAAGNCMILKPPEQAPLSSVMLMELLADVFPPGVLNAVFGDRGTGAALVEHPGVAKVAFTGSVDGGCAVMSAAARHAAPTLLELGGKNALIVYPDADLDRAVDGAVRGMNFLWCGQSCGSTSRILVHASIHDEFVQRLCRRIVECHRPGIPTDWSTTMGCLGSEAAYRKVMAYIEAGKAAGAHLALGGRHPPETQLQRGWFIEPTVFSEVTPAMSVAREEIFGPVVCVLSWDQEQIMLETVNGLPLGLTCSIWTRDLDTAIRVARDVEAGYCWVNNASTHFPGAPFGGYKRSGVEREESIDELFGYTQIKNVNIAAAPRRSES